MEDNSQIVKALESVLCATDTALRLAEDSVKASRNALTQSKVLFDSLQEFDTESEICHNCHAKLEDCRGMFHKCDNDLKENTFLFLKNGFYFSKLTF